MLGDFFAKHGWQIQRGTPRVCRTTPPSSDRIAWQLVQNLVSVIVLSLRFIFMAVDLRYRLWCRRVNVLSLVYR
jgi:hypothetical protein